MSTFVLKPVEYAQVFATIVNESEYSSAFQDFDQTDLAWAEIPGNSIESLTENRIGCFVDRLYIANQTTFCYQYKEPMNIERLDVFTAARLSAYQLQEKLRSIRYNCCTNEGTSFLSKADDEKLDALIFRSMAKALRAMPVLESP